jgi:tetratricopeptide (TPR) repeat protein
MRTILRLSLIAAGTVAATAQVLHPDVRDKVTDTPAPPAQGGGQGGSQQTTQEPKKNNSPFGNELPFFDPSGETVAWNGHTWAATDNRLLAARFERYLNEPEDNSEAAKEYRDTIWQILEKVSPHHPGGPDFAAGVKLLPRASSFPADAKLCDSLSQAIYTAVLAKKDVTATRALNVAMEDEKQRLIRNADTLAKGTRNGERRAFGPQGRRDQNEGGNNNNQQQQQQTPEDSPEQRTGTGTDSMAYREAERRVDEIEGMKKENLSKGEIQIFQAKVQYQALMMQFFVQRRFEHVLMASRFYNQIFKDGDSKLHIDKKSDMSKLFGESLGTSPTVSALDSLASEAIRDVDQGVEAFKFLLEKKEYQSAAKRLTESYIPGEFMPSIRTLPRTDKRKILEFVRESYKLIAAIDAKDYTTAKTLVAKLKESSGDFDSTKADAAIATYTRVSSMHIDAAKLAASKGDHEKASEEVQKAMEVWPQNPKLAEFDKLVETGSGMAVAKNDFDRLVSEANYREIFRRQYELAPAIAGDANREEAFKQIITNLGKIEQAIAKASEFSKAGQEEAAWEQLAEIRKDFPDDPKLGAELERLAPDVAEFTKALMNAREFEERRDKQVGSALSWYLKARSIYPRSEMAEQGIERMLEQILPDDRSSAKASASGKEEQ